MTTLIIAEKPSSSEKIAAALAEGKVEKKTNFGVGYFKIRRGGKNIIVAPAAGHLFVLTESGPHRWHYPVFKVTWKPVYQNKNMTWSKKYFQNLKKLSTHAKEFISACDYDIEGSVIAFNIMRFICHVKDGKRMKFSTLTKPDLIDAYENISPHLDFGMINAGLARHYLDYFWGINTSRALILSIKRAGGFKILSTGRVQGPTLNILQKREKEIRSFVSSPFWEIQLTGRVNHKEILALHITGRFLKKREASTILKKCSRKNGTVEEVKKKEYNQNPPFPFDLTTLQREAYQHFKFSPKQTLDIAQSLYEQALISYPRTSSQKLPAQLGYKDILKHLKKQKVYSPLCQQLLKKSLKPHEGYKEDSAHPSIFPTGGAPKVLGKYEKKLYDLIVRRFLAVFADAAVRERVKATILIEGERFVSEGVRTLQANWIDFYIPYATVREVILPPLKKGDVIKNDKLEMLDKETSPPPRFTQATILKEMEKLGLGTKATRAGILHTLYGRGYIDGKSIEVTKLGEAVITALEKYCSEIISVHLTRTFEESMEAISEGKWKQEQVIQEAQHTLKKVLAVFKKHEKSIGKELLTGVREAMRAESTIGPCTCGKTLIIRKSHVGKRFVGCTGYPNCTETFSLPHAGTVAVSSKKCDCGLFIISVKQPKKRPWKLCVRCGFKK